MIESLVVLDNRNHGIREIVRDRNNDIIAKFKYKYILDLIIESEVSKGLVILSSLRYGYPLVNACTCVFVSLRDVIRTH